MNDLTDEQISEHFHATVNMLDFARAVIAADRAAQQDSKPEHASEPQSCRTDDGMPTERAVLEREWMEQKEALKAQQERKPMGRQAREQLWRSVQRVGKIRAGVVAAVIDEVEAFHGIKETT